MGTATVADILSLKTQRADPRGGKSALEVLHGLVASDMADVNATILRRMQSPVALIPLGKPVKQLTKLSRKPVDEFAFSERYDGDPLGD